VTTIWSLWSGCGPQVAAELQKTGWASQAHATDPQRLPGSYALSSVPVDRGSGECRAPCRAPHLHGVRRGVGRTRVCQRARRSRQTAQATELDVEDVNDPAAETAGEVEIVVDGLGADRLAGGDRDVAPNR
jgi:hypothetical protein